MCGRFVLSPPADAIAEEFSALTGGLALKPRYNIAPMQDVVVVRVSGGQRVLAVLRWGLIPFWAKDPAIASKLINARSETAATKPSFREALKKRRCIVPATGFYEWKKEGTRKQPWYFQPSRPGALLGIAAMWERWKDPEGNPVDTVCLLTTAANSVLSPVHDRMPVVLDDAGVKRWLDDSIADAAKLQDLLVPGPPAEMTGHPVSTAVNSVRNDDARNVESIETVKEPGPSPGGQQSLF